MDKRLSQVQQRAVQYWFVDGLAEIGAGLVSLLLAGLFLFWKVLLTSRWSLLLILLGLLAFSFGSRMVIQRIKERTTYRWTGYAAPLTGRMSKTSMLLIAAFTLLLLLLNAYLTIYNPQNLLQSAAVPGLVFALFFGLTAFLVKLTRLYILTLVSLLAGVVMAFLDIDSMAAAGILSGLTGIILLVQGLLVRQFYLSHTPPQDQVNDE